MNAPTKKPMKEPNEKINLWVTPAMKKALETKNIRNITDGEYSYASPFIRDAISEKLKTYRVENSDK